MAAKNDTWKATEELKGCAPADYYDIEFDDQMHTVELQGTIAEHIMRDPSTQSASLQEAPLVVTKYGCTTGLTIGVTNQAVDTFDDDDSAISTLNTSSLTSLRSSVLRVQEENGRTYHSMSSGNIQHNVWLLTLDGELGLSPKISEPAKRVLDVGTGTGIWAVEYADLHPESEVIGVDLSPIQPSLPS
ncbi:hypothetical protein LRP88_11465 [Fusarium phalaenopsidis]